MGTGPVWPVPLAYYFFLILKRVCKNYISQRHVCCFKELKTSLYSLDSAGDHLLAQTTSCLNVRLAFLCPGPGMSWPHGTRSPLPLFCQPCIFLLSHPPPPALGPSSCNKPQVFQTLNWNWMLDLKKKKKIMIITQLF